MDKNKIILIVLVAVIALYLDYTLVISSQVKAIADIKPQIAKLKVNVVKLEKDLAAVKVLQSKKALMKDEILSRLKKVITEQEVTTLLEEVANLAAKHSVKLMQIKPMKDAAFKRPVPGASAASLKFNSQSISLTLLGKYHEFGMFLNDLENAEQLMEVESLRIGNDPSNPAYRRIDLILKVYVKK